MGVFIRADIVRHWPQRTTAADRIIKDGAIGARLTNEPAQQAIPVLLVAGRMKPPTQLIERRIGLLRIASHRCRDQIALIIGAAARHWQNVINGRCELPEGEMTGIPAPVGLKRELGR